MHSGAGLVLHLRLLQLCLHCLLQWLRPTLRPLPITLIYYYPESNTLYLNLYYMSYSNIFPLTLAGAAPLFPIIGT
jgi:hypothetical protein